MRRMQAAGGSWVLALAGALSLAMLMPSVSLAAHPPPISGVLDTEGSVNVDGQLQANATAGVVHVRVSDLNGAVLRLHAERVHLDYSWRAGYNVRAGDVVWLARITPNYGRQQENYTSVDAAITSFQRDPQILALLHQDMGMISGRASGIEALQVVSGVYLMRVEKNDQSIQAVPARPFGFWYQVSNPSPGTFGLDAVVVSGTFLLAINNVTIQGDTDQGDLNHWSGNKESNDPAQPSESRVTTLLVTNGTLTMEVPDSLSLIAPEVFSSVCGTVTAEKTTGELLGQAMTYKFDSTPLELDGCGTLVLRPLVGVGEMGGQFAQENPFRLSVSTNGDFDVRSGLAIATPARSSDGGLPTWLLVAFVASVLSPLVAVVSVRRLRRRRGRPRAAAASADEDLAAVGAEGSAEFEEDLEAAADVFKARDYAGAAQALQRLAARRPERPDAWELLAEARMQLNQYAEAADAWKQVNEAVGEPDEDALAGLTRAAWLAGRHDEARRAVVALADRVPERAADLLHRPTFAPLAKTALDELSNDAVDALVDLSWKAGRRDEARRYLVALATRSPELSIDYAMDPQFGTLGWTALSDLTPEALVAWIKAAWDRGLTTVTANAMVQLAKRDPQRAVELLQDPMYAPFLEDVRVAQLVSRVEKPANDRPDGYL